jgi:hypothetical protein
MDGLRECGNEILGHASLHSRCSWSRVSASSPLTTSAVSPSS